MKAKGSSNNHPTAAAIYRAKKNKLISGSRSRIISQTMDSTNVSPNNASKRPKIQPVDEGAAVTEIWKIIDAFAINHSPEDISRLVDKINHRIEHSASMEMDNNDPTPSTSQTALLNDAADDSMGEFLTVGKKNKILSADELNQQNKKQKLAKSPQHTVPVAAIPPKTTRVVSARKTRIPPIIFPVLDNSKLIEKATTSKFNIQILKNNQKIIKCEDKASHALICHYLREENIESHTYQTTEDKNIVYLCKGIQFSVNPDIIKQDLERQIGDVVISVRNHETPRSRKGNYKLDMHVIQFKPNTCIPDILAITGIYWHKVQWQKFTAKLSTQCVNCRNFGHSRNYCTYKFRCVRCKNDHPPGICPYKEVAKAVCVNCSGEHPASYRGCPAYDKFLKKTHPRPQRRSNQPVEPSSGAVRHTQWQPSLMRQQTAHHGDTFASMVTAKPITQTSMAQPSSRETSTQPAQQPSSGTRNHTGESGSRGGMAEDFFFNDPLALFGVNAYELNEKLKGFYASYSTLTNLFDKQMAYIKFLQHLNING